MDITSSESCPVADFQIIDVQHTSSTVRQSTHISQAVQHHTVTLDSKTMLHNCELRTQN